MKFILEIVISWLFHPIAVVLCWINIAGRSDFSFSKKLVWAIVCLVWGIGPTLYLLVGDGSFW
jgi:hypothetical protein